MPANKKYLTQSPWQRIAKITAGFIGGYIVTITLHLALATWLNHVNVIITLTYSGFILWATLMIVAFLAKSGWKIWAIYLALAFLFYVIFYFGNMYNPIIQP
ncbi:hypothetical protein [Galbibacter pacificus]|uniref:Uncharacterized protein n=1 Tax=Galbibacter pacificus TaxID=2996052 RepID=A0ABT6FVJ9_9FLAO|nr:hypothetical protein [Galbibacter pacificus]MDG3583805.1 hypothetical protein [Galbibacter pacificus]MDG3587277.1 hypothetical protein [Galbibacter pacificus]